MPNKITRSLEEYLKALLEVEERKGHARVKDITERLGVKAPSVVEALQKLDRLGLVRYSKHDSIVLTGEGRERALELKRRHEALAFFLQQVLGLEAGQASRQACSIEHFLEEVVLERLTAFLDFIRTCPFKQPVCLQEFRAYLQTGERPSPPLCRRAEGGTG